MNVDLNTWVLLGVAILNGMTLYYTRRTELNTNSLATELNKRTAESAHAAGKEEGRVEGIAKAAVLAEGQLAGSKEKMP